VLRHARHDELLPLSGFVIGSKVERERQPGANRRVVAFYDDDSLPT
jgi:hypothetical protein